MGIASFLLSKEHVTRRGSGYAQISSAPAVEPAMMDRRALGPFLDGLSPFAVGDAMGICWKFEVGLDSCDITKKKPRNRGS